MDHRPVIGGNQGHLAVLDIFVEHIQSRRRTRTPCGSDRCAGFVAKVAPGSRKQPVKESDDLAGSRGIIDRGTDHQSVRFFHFRRDSLHRCVDIPVNRIFADVDDLRIDSCRRQFLRDLGKGCKGASFLISAAVKH